VPVHEFQKWRYQIDIDGNTNSWPGLFTKLLSGSTVLKVASPRGYRQWYYRKLVPWINFVPVASDLSNLVDRIRWLRANDDAAREIGRQGRILAESMDYESELNAAAIEIKAAFRFSQDSAQPGPNFVISDIGKQAVTERDVELAYYLLLRRAPEHKQIIAQQLDSARDLDDLRNQLWNSSEFRARIGSFLR